MQSFSIHAIKKTHLSITQEHVGEYGVHWNFFASVAFVALLSHAVHVSPRHLPLLAAAVTCCHQVGHASSCTLNICNTQARADVHLFALNTHCVIALMLSFLFCCFAHTQAVLSFCGWGAWGLTESRDMSSLLDMNKEGLVSVTGYWALHLWGASAAYTSTAVLHEQVGVFECECTDC